MKTEEEAKQEAGKEFYESADKVITIKRQEEAKQRAKNSMALKGALDVKEEAVSQTAVEWLFEKMITEKHTISEWNEILIQAKAMESKQLFLASNTSAKDAYKAGQETMSCGCYQISDATTYEEWLYEQFKNTEVTNESKRKSK